MDLLYDLQHGIFAKGAGGAVEAVIVVLTWAFSITILRWSWTRRDELAGLTRVSPTSRCLLGHKFG